MKPLRYMLIIVMLIILAPFKTTSKPIKTTSKPMACNPPDVVDLSQPISDCFSYIGTATTSFGWGVFWADGAFDTPSQTATGTCDVGWPCVPKHQSAQVESVYCQPSILEAFPFALPEQNVAFFRYQVASNGTTVNYYACGNCFHGFAGDPNGKSITCHGFPHQVVTIAGACN